MPPVSPPVLVAYASPHGSTAEVAEAVGETLRAAGDEADVCDVADAGHVDGYASVVRMEAGDIRDWDRIRGWARSLTEPIHAE